MRRVPALALAVLLVPALAQADWQPGGSPIGFGNYFVAAASGPDRIVVAWIQDAGPGHTQVRMQAWTADGDVASGWPTAGVLVSDLPGTNIGPAICEDGAGGAFVAWTSHQEPERSVYLQHVSAAGGLVSGWAADGLRFGAVPPYYDGAPVVAHDGAGGVLVGSIEYHDGREHGARVQRVDAGGRPATGWPVAGLSIPNAYDLGLVVDVERHVFVSTAEYDPVQSMAGFRVQRMDDGAAPDPGWPERGVLLTQVGAPIGMRLIPDGAGGVYAGWSQALIPLLPCHQFYPCTPVHPATTRIRADGVRDEGWIPGFLGSSSAPDGTGGVLLGLVRGGRPSVRRLDPSAETMPGWAVGGNAAMTEVVGLGYVLVAGDGEGGAFAVWQDGRTGTQRLYASRLDAEGRLAHGWPATGSFVDADRGYPPSGVQLVSLGGGVAIAVWELLTPQGHFAYLTALRPGEPGPIADLGPVPAEVGFGVVHVRPNPARGPIVAIVELQNEGPARLDLVDATGRLLESQDFSFPWQAWGAVFFNQSRTLPPGVYWIRVTQGVRRATKKVVVLE